MEDNDLSINRMMETAMGLSMASMFTESMASVCRANINAIESTYSKQPPRYIYAIINGTQQGPFSLGEVLERVRAGEISPDTYIWKQGMAEWKLAKDVEDISPSLQQLPPPLPQI